MEKSILSRLIGSYFSVFSKHLHEAQLLKFMTILSWTLVGLYMSI